MILQDRKEREKGVAKNAVEAYVYDMRGKLFSQLEKFITQEVICLLTNYLYHDIKEFLLVSLDLSAPFDTLDHDILIKRVATRFSLTGKVLSWFKPYLYNRK